MPALLPRGARALRTGDDSGGRGYLIWQFGKVFSGCRIWRGTGDASLLRTHVTKDARSILGGHATPLHFLKMPLQ